MSARVAFGPLAALALAACASRAGEPPLDGAGSDGATGDAPTCAAESDPALCARLGATCGRVSGQDLCGHARTDVACGPCVAPAAVCGFAGDPTGATDSAAALRDALQCAVDHGYVPVSVPAGTYALGTRIAVPAHVALVGEAHGSFGMNGPEPYDALPMLRFASALAGDGLVLAAGASLTGLQLEAAGQTGAASAVVRIAGEAVVVRNVKITGGQWGLRAEDAVDARGLYVSNVFMVAPQSGVYVGHATTGARVENVHVWNNATAAAGSAGFVFGSVAALQATLLSAFNYDLAIGLRNTGDARVVGFEGDFCHNGLQAQGSARATLSGSSMFSHLSAVLVDDDASVLVVGSHLSSNGAATAWLRGAGASLTLAGTTIVRNATTWNAPAVQVEGGRTLVVTGNTIDVHGVGVLFTGAPGRGTVYGNTIEVSGAGNTAWSPAGVGNTGFTANATNAAP